MNTAEKIAATYLRLNGFLLLPQFTVFDGEQHNHIDLLALRAPRSEEMVGDFRLPVDEDLFVAAGKFIADPKNKLLGVLAEVRTNANKDAISEGHRAYAARFLGGSLAFGIAFYDTPDAKLTVGSQHLEIGVGYALKKILSRIKTMSENTMRLRKMGSWYLSEEWLADILVLRQYGSFKGLE